MERVFWRRVARVFWLDRGAHRRPIRLRLSLPGISLVVVTVEHGGSAGGGIFVAGTRGMFLSRLVLHATTAHSRAIRTAT